MQYCSGHRPSELSCSQYNLYGYIVGTHHAEPVVVEANALGVVVGLLLLLPDASPCEPARMQYCSGHRPRELSCWQNNMYGDFDGVHHAWWSGCCCCCCRCYCYSRPRPYGRNTAPGSDPPRSPARNTSCTGASLAHNACVSQRGSRWSYSRRCPLQGCSTPLGTGLPRSPARSTSCTGTSSARTAWCSVCWSNWSYSPC
mmetsp:Transcript_22444/g.64490  ORF Transcript_22444/g.64490 Transcript_22444/m.64490 type:complete len:200 (+) Transcript_22444:801-1400(+)